MIKSPFNWQGPSQTGKEFKPKAFAPGKLPPIVLAGTPKWAKPLDKKPSS